MTQRSSHTFRPRRPLHRSLPRRLALGVLAPLALAAAHAQTAPEGLAAALNATLSHHPAIQGKRAEAQASDFLVREARSQRLPSVSAQASQYLEDKRSAVTDDDLSTPLTLRLRQPVYAFGRISDSIEVAKAGSRREQADLFRVARELLEETALAYVAVLGARDRIEVAEANLAQLEELQAQIQRRAEGQLASEADNRLAGTRVAQGRVQLERYRGDLEIGLSELHALTQEPIPAAEPVSATVTALPPAAELRQTIYEQSPELRLRQERIEEAAAESKRSRSAAYPTVYLQAEQFHDQPGLRDDSQVSLVFDASAEGLGFAARHRSGAANARRNAAEQDLVAARLELMRRFQRLQSDRRLRETLLEVQSASVEDLEALLDSYRRQYESGSKSWLDLLNIQRELNEQRLQHAQLENEWLAQTLHLQALSGGLDSLAGLEIPQ